MRATIKSGQALLNQATRPADYNQIASISIAPPAERQSGSAATTFTARAATQMPPIKSASGGMAFSAR